MHTHDKSERVLDFLNPRTCILFCLTWISLGGGAQVRAPTKTPERTRSLCRAIGKGSCLYLEFDPSSG